MKICAIKAYVDAERQTSPSIHGLKFLWQQQNTYLKLDSFNICKEDPVKINVTS